MNRRAASEVETLHLGRLREKCLRAGEGNMGTVKEDRNRKREAAVVFANAIKRRRGIALFFFHHQLPLSHSGFLTFICLPCPLSAVSFRLEGQSSFGREHFFLRNMSVFLEGKERVWKEKKTAGTQKPRNRPKTKRGFMNTSIFHAQLLFSQWADVPINSTSTVISVMPY